MATRRRTARTRTLAQFKAGSLRVLVATDIAARGLDIEALPHVVNYDMPHVAEDYVHRIGRTGRAGVEGEAVSLVSPEERPLLAAIERLINRKVREPHGDGLPGRWPEARRRLIRRITGLRTRGTQGGGAAAAAAPGRRRGARARTSRASARSWESESKIGA